jgi:RNA polymerase sigma-70 factor (ECF subfamily)
MEPFERVSRIVQTERGMLAALARAEGVSPEDAVDAVQDALCTLLAQARNGTLPANDDEWLPLLTGIVKNAARNRRRRHYLARPHDEIDAHPLADEDALATDEAIARAETHVRLRACVEDLCEVERAVVTLRMLEQKPGEDVARVLGISTNHVAVLLHRAKHTLRTCMTRSA